MALHVIHVYFANKLKKFRSEHYDYITTVRTKDEHVRLLPNPTNYLSKHLKILGKMIRVRAKVESVPFK